MSLLLWALENAIYIHINLCIFFKVYKQLIDKKNQKKPHKWIYDDLIVAALLNVSAAQSLNNISNG